MRGRTDQRLIIGPPVVRRLVRMVTADPGRTPEEYAASAGGDRQIVIQRLAALVRARRIRRDPHGRLWPV